MRGEHQNGDVYNITDVGSSPHARGAPRPCDRRGRRDGIIPACAGSTSTGCPARCRGRDHPRMRGEHRWLFCMLVLELGSSPHARGARVRRLLRRFRQGIIPACAGSTASRRRRRTSKRDHPRMRGEHSLVRRLRQRREGIIPACAGSTDAARYTTRRERDHPRMHGEHGPPVTRAQEAGGSSPHARGAPHERPRPDRAGGIIPACAGSTRGKHLFRLDTGDHPRMRGEHGATRQNLWSNPGSSPHARGALLAARRAARAVGIIPACAGSTMEFGAEDGSEEGSSPHARGAPRGAGARTGCPRDHPRMRGEHRSSRGWNRRFRGSSPHARGAHSQVHLHDLVHGIIPACAGSTKRLLVSALLRWDHPRMRGEHVPQFKACVKCVGSSPHARGAHAVRVVPEATGGIIPACAGSTARWPKVRARARDHPRMRGEHMELHPEQGYDKGSSPHARGAHTLGR